MTLKQLHKEISKREAKKVSISIGNIREVIRILVEMEREAIVEGDGNLSPVNAIYVEAMKKVGNKAD